jgi:hypothetical protein
MGWLNWVVGGSVVDGMAQLGSWWLSSGWDGSIGQLAAHYSGSLLSLGKSTSVEERVS